MTVALSSPRHAAEECRDITLSNRVLGLHAHVANADIAQVMLSNVSPNAKNSTYVPIMRPVVRSGIHIQAARATPHAGDATQCWHTSLSPATGCNIAQVHSVKAAQTSIQLHAQS